MADPYVPIPEPIPTLDDRSDEEAILMSDPRFAEAVRLFNTADWYACHDGFEELWHETQGPMRAVLQGILQIAVAQLHLEQGNHHGATLLMGEGVGRLADSGSQALGVDLQALRAVALDRLQALQGGGGTEDCPNPQLVAPGSPAPDHATSSG